jgi:hypothetical protein
VAGVAALFIAMPLKFQPGSIDFLVGISSGYLRYAPSPKFSAFGVQIVFSAITVFLGGVPLFNALRSCGSKLFAAVLLGPLILFSLIQMVRGARYYAANGIFFTEYNFFYCSVYFWPEAFLRNYAGDPNMLDTGTPALIASLAEAIKWCTMLTIAVWLSVAQVVAWRGLRKPAIDGKR